MDAGIFIKELLKDIFGVINVEIRVVTDNKSLAQVVSVVTAVDDKRLRVDIACLREAVEKETVSGFYWVPSQFNLANPLTKQGASNKHLLDVLQHKLMFDFERNFFV